MSITVTERYDHRKARAFLARRRRYWDVHQEGLLVGVFYSEQEAHAYRIALELEARYRFAAEF